MTCADECGVKEEEVQGPDGRSHILVTSMSNIADIFKHDRTPQLKGKYNVLTNLKAI